MGSSTKRKRRKSTAVHEVTTSSNSNCLGGTSTIASNYEIYPCRKCYRTEILGVPSLNQDYDEREEILVEFVQMKNGCRFKDKELMSKTSILPYHGIIGNDDHHHDEKQPLVLPPQDPILTPSKKQRQTLQQPPQQQQKQQWNQDILKQYLHQEKSKLRKGINKHVQSRAMELYLQKVLDVSKENEWKKQKEEEEEEEIAKDEDCVVGQNPNDNMRTLRVETDPRVKECTSGSNIDNDNKKKKRSLDPKLGNHHQKQDTLLSSGSELVFDDSQNSQTSITAEHTISSSTPPPLTKLNKSSQSYLNAEREWRLSQIKVGSKISMYWPDDGKYYIVQLRKPSKKQQMKEGMKQQHVYTLEYEGSDDIEKDVDVTNEAFKVLDEFGNVITFDHIQDAYERKEEPMNSKSSSKSPSPVPIHKKPSKESLLSKLKIGSYVSVYWPKDKEFYNATISRPTKRSKKKNPTSSCHIYTLHYDDGEIEENIDLSKEEFKLLDDDNDENDSDIFLAKAKNVSHTSAMLISQEIDDGELIVNDGSDDEVCVDDKNVNPKKAPLVEDESNSDSDLSIFNTAYKHKSEPLRPLDVIEYYPPTAIFGDHRFLEITQILSVDPRRNPIMKLTNQAYLDSDVKVKRIKRIIRGKLRDYDGKYRAISEYKLSKGSVSVASSGGEISGVQMKANELSEILKKQREQCIEKVKAAGLGDCSDLLNTIGK